MTVHSPGYDTTVLHGVIENLSGFPLERKNSRDKIPGESQADKMVSFEFNQDLRVGIRARLGRFDRRQVAPGKLRQAAVAIVLLPEERGNEACFVLTRRPQNLRHHGGQYALPGGRVEVGEAEMELAFAHRKEIVEHLKKVGYLWVSLDLSGLRSGSLNDQLKLTPAGRSN